MHGDPKKPEHFKNLSIGGFRIFHVLDASSYLFSSKIVISNNFFGWQMSFICWFVILIFPLISTAINPFILNSFSSNYRATVNLNTYSLNVSLFLSVASTKFILQNKSQTSKLNSLGIKTKETNQSPVVDFVIF